MRQLILLMICSFAAPVAKAHDLDENRATLVLRDRTHLSVTLYLNYAQALHRALLPHREYGAFLLMYSSMKPDDLEKELQRAQAKFELETRMTPSGTPARQPVPLMAWTWPRITQVQTMLQRQAMQAIVDGHVHEPPTEIHAHAVSPQEVTAITIRFPAEFERVLVVFYRPNQVWVDPRSPSPAIKF